MLDRVDPRIVYVVTVPDWRPEEATPLAGFSLSLCESSPLLRLIGHLPSDIFERVPELWEAAIVRRMAGMGELEWHCQSPRAIRSAPWPVELPFGVVFLGHGDSAADYQSWLNESPVRPLIVADTGGDLRPSELGLDELQGHLLRTCDRLAGLVTAERLEEARQHIRQWQPPPREKLGYIVNGHGTIAPNILALRAAGLDVGGEQPFQMRGDGDHQRYVDQIAATSQSLIELRRRTPLTYGDQLFPRRPELTLFVPGIYDLSHIQAKSSAPAEERRALRSAKAVLERQSGYNFTTSSDAQFRAMTGHTAEELRAGTEPRMHWLLQLRQREVHLASDAVALLAASEIGAVARLPYDANRTAGAVRQFASHYRGRDSRPARTLDSFRAVQGRIGQAVPDELKALIGKAEGEIRIIADAHLAWLDLDGVPLGVRRDVAHIPATPGNLFIGQLEPKPAIRLTADGFAKILVISALERKDPIAPMFGIAFSMFAPNWKDKVDVRFVEVGNADELVAALNAFDGAMVIFDGHGSHEPDQPAVLHLKNSAVDIWSLRGRLDHAPPIIVLSACDTHAADRNHATTANGFLSLGARAVLSAVLPIDAIAAATFTARLIWRIVGYLPLQIRRLERPVTWTEVIGGMLRLQLVTDMLRHCLRKGLIPSDQFEGHMMHCCMEVNLLKDDPFAEVRARLIGSGLDTSQVDRELRLAVATSSVISYRNIGRPETILIDDQSRLEGLTALPEEADEDAIPQPIRTHLNQ